MRWIGSPAILVLALILTLTGTAVAQPRSVSGDTAALERTLGEPSAVRYQIRVVSDAIGEGKTAYLDRVLDQQGWPDPDTLLLIVFAADNYDIRFAMGADFRREQVSVAEMTALVHTAYLPLVRRGNPAGGLAALVRWVNLRMAPDPARPAAIP